MKALKKRSAPDADTATDTFSDSKFFVARQKGSNKFYFKETDKAVAPKTKVYETDTGYTACIDENWVEVISGAEYTARKLKHLNGLLFPNEIDAEKHAEMKSMCREYEFLHCQEIFPEFKEHKLEKSIVISRSTRLRILEERSPSVEPESVMFNDNISLADHLREPTDAEVALLHDHGIISSLDRYDLLCSESFFSDNSQVTGTAQQPDLLQQKVDLAICQSYFKK